VRRLIQLNVVRTRDDHHDDMLILALLDRTSEQPLARKSATVVSMSSHMSAIA
jgi:hypothetical protein